MSSHHDPNHNGRSQAVRLPVEFRFEGKEVFVERVPATESLAYLLNSAPKITPNFPNPTALSPNLGTR